MPDGLCRDFHARNRRTAERNSRVTVGGKQLRLDLP
jgi:hypothetical protein